MIVLKGSWLEFFSSLAIPEEGCAEGRILKTFQKSLIYIKPLRKLLQKVDFRIWGKYLVLYSNTAFLNCSTSFYILAPVHCE